MPKLNNSKLPLLYSLFHAVQKHVWSSNGETVVIDGIEVPKSSVRHLFDDEGNRLVVETGTNVDLNEDPLELEDPEYTSQLPTKCQVCRLMVKEMENRLAKFGQIKTITKKNSRPIYYKDEMVFTTVLYELCNEMRNYSYVKNSPFRYKKWGICQCMPGGMVTERNGPCITPPIMPTSDILTKHYETSKQLGKDSYVRVKSSWRQYVEQITKGSKIKQWIWNYSQEDIDDPTGEIRRLITDCQLILREHEETFHHWFFKAQKKDPVIWLCVDKILLEQDHDCIWDEMWEDEETIDQSERQVEDEILDEHRDHEQHQEL